MMSMIGIVMLEGLITLFVVPAVYGCVDCFRELVEKPMCPVYEYEISPTHQAAVVEESHPFAFNTTDSPADDEGGDIPLRAGQTDFFLTILLPPWRGVRLYAAGCWTGLLNRIL
ncbi:MAG TPA: hypothetical protein PKY31_15285 [Spirochaetota bacterium]|nr:hypothetical protein [Spirochaetota bacterium]